LLGPGTRRTLLAVIDAKRALLSQVVGREVVSRVSRALTPASIPLLVLKGVWLQACVYAPHEPRIITDVDLLVPDHQFECALIELEHGGWRRWSSNAFASSLVHEDLQLPVDLHRSLFARGTFCLPTRAVFARSRTDEAVFGASVRLPDPRDGLAHLVGHFVKSRTPCGDPVRLRDFVAIARHCGLDPVDCAGHLHAAGMARAARYVLHALVHDRHDTFYRDLLAALPRDPLSKPLAKLARTIARRSPITSPLGAVPGFLVDRSLPAGAHALVLRWLDVRHERALR
jgi:hypothetical protein